MNNKIDEIQKAVEKIVGHKLDAILVLGFNTDGMELTAGKGKMVAIAALLADLFENQPELEKMVGTVKKLKIGKLPDELVKALFNALGGDDDE